MGLIGSSFASVDVKEQSCYTVGVGLTLQAPRSLLRSGGLCFKHKGKYPRLLFASIAIGKYLGNDW